MSKTNKQTNKKWVGRGAFWNPGELRKARKESLEDVKWDLTSRLNETDNTGLNYVKGREREKACSKPMLIAYGEQPRVTTSAASALVKQPSSSKPVSSSGFVTVWPRLTNPSSFLGLAHFSPATLTLLFFQQIGFIPAAGPLPRKLFP